MPDAQLIINSVAYLGWTSISVTRSIEQLAHTFELEFSEMWTGQSKPMPIVEGQACTVKLGNDDVTVGYVDDASIDYDAGSHSLRVSGRSVTGDLVDCAAIHKAQGEWFHTPLAIIAADLVQPFGLTVSVQTDLGKPFSKFALQPGESVYEALERACRMRGVLMLTSGSGQLVFTRSGVAQTRTVIKYGDNVIRGSRSGSWKDRYSQYIVKAQVAGDDAGFGLFSSQPKAVSLDAQITRYRPLITMAEAQETGVELKKRADFERNVRAGRSQRLRYTLQGWENDEGLWSPNILAHVIDPRLKVDATLLVTSVTLRKDADGTVTELELADPKIATVEPLVPKPLTTAWIQ